MEGPWARKPCAPCLGTSRRAGLWPTSLSPSAFGELWLDLVIRNDVSLKGRRHELHKQIEARLVLGAQATRKPRPRPMTSPARPLPAPVEFDVSRAPLPALVDSHGRLENLERGSASHCRETPEHLSNSLRGCLRGSSDSL